MSFDTTNNGVGMSFLLLRPQDLKDLLTMKEGIDLVEESYRGIKEFPVINAPRRRVHSPSGVRVSTSPGACPVSASSVQRFARTWSRSKKDFKPFVTANILSTSSIIQQPTNCSL